VFSRFDRIPACDRRTDGRTDRQADRRTDILPQCRPATRYAYPSRDKNCFDVAPNYPFFGIRGSVTHFQSLGVA